FNGFCRAAECKALDMAIMRATFDLMLDHLATEPGDKKAGEKKEDAKKDDPKDLLDGIPEWFVGPLIAELVAHEVGHTLGLRHNFKASSIYSLAQINSSEIKGKKPFAGSVMDYLPVNIFDWENRDQQGDYTMIDIGPYDLWAIQYGYCQSDKTEHS